MPYFRYIGDPLGRDPENHPGYDANDPQQATVGKHTFDLNGDAVQVDDKLLAARLTGNRHFEKVDGRTLGSAKRDSAEDSGGQSAEPVVETGSDTAADSGGASAETG